VSEVDTETFEAGQSPAFLINCPKCGAKHVPAKITTLKETLDLVIRQTTTWVKCSACGTSLYSKRPAAEIIGMTPEQLERVLVNRVSLVSRVVAILAIVLCLFPFVGLAVAALSMALNWKAHGWSRKLSLIALPIALLMTVVAGVVIMMDTKK